MKGQSCFWHGDWTERIWDYLVIKYGKGESFLLLYYISGFGYGHLTRSLAVVEALLELDPKLQIILRCHPAHIPLALEYLHRFTSRVESTQFV